MFQNHNPITTVIMSIIAVVILVAVTLTTLEIKNFVVRVRATQSRQLRRFRRKEDGDIDDILPDMQKLFDIM